MRVSRASLALAQSQRLLVARTTTTTTTTTTPPPPWSWDEQKDLVVRPSLAAPAPMPPHDPSVVVEDLNGYEINYWQS